MDKKDIILFFSFTTCLLIAYVIFERRSFLNKPRKPPKFLASYVEEEQKRKLFPSEKWEEMTLNDPPITNGRSIASSKNSRLFFVNKKARYFVGDTVIVKIIVRDVDGRRKTKGGDEIRIRTSGGKLTGAAGTVVDNGDGTYQGRVKLFWPGNVTIEAKVFTPREMVAYLYRNVRYGNTSRVYVGGFGAGSEHETVRCTGSSDLAKTYNGFCDLRQTTYGLPWFCEKPKHLACTEWAFSRMDKVPLNLTVEQRQMLITLGRHGFITSSLKLVAVKRTNGAYMHPDGTSLQSSIPCNKIPARETWRARTPVGYAHEGRWFPSFCSSSRHRYANSTRECLKGRRVWFIGDSTTRQMFSFMMKNLKLKLVSEKWKTEKWYNLSIAEDVLSTFSVAYAVHGLPFGYGGHEIAPSQLEATHRYINKIPADSRDIIVVLFYSHFHTQHPEVLRQSVRKTVEAVGRLKHRAPDTTVIVKGPHAMPACRYPSNDFWGIISTQILREEFTNLQNDVIYLDLWDLTVASKSLLLHPDKERMKMIMNLFMSLICP